MLVQNCPLISVEARQSLQDAGYPFSLWYEQMCFHSIHEQKADFVRILVRKIGLQSSLAWLKHTCLPFETFENQSR